MKPRKTVSLTRSAHHKPIFHIGSQFHFLIHLTTFGAQASSAPSLSFAGEVNFLSPQRRVTDALRAHCKMFGFLMQLTRYFDAEPDVRINSVGSPSVSSSRTLCLGQTAVAMSKLAVYKPLLRYPNYLKPNHTLHS